MALQSGAGRFHGKGVFEVGFIGWRKFPSGREDQWRKERRGRGKEERKLIREKPPEKEQR